jgi:hypothetical protein
MTMPAWPARLAAAGFVGWFVRRQLGAIAVVALDRDGVVIDARDRFGRATKLARRQVGADGGWTPASPNGAPGLS